MKRIFFEVAYDGTDFSGWQVQPDRISVQETIEKHLAEIYVNQPVRIHASGRTDAGVHAMGQTVTFDPPDRPEIPPENLMNALNNSLPDSITVRVAEFAPSPDFHARYSAVGKAYTYFLNTAEKTPFNSRYSWHQPACTDICGIRKAADILTGTHDFSSFTTSRKDIDNAVRTLYRIDIDTCGDYLCLTFVGSGFLYKMIRGLTGALVLVGSGRLAVSDVADILKAEDRAKAPKGAPPNGLFLMKVFYDDEKLKSYQFTNTSMPIIP